jgi:hypothetical protein
MSVAASEAQRSLLLMCSLSLLACHQPSVRRWGPQSHEAGCIREHPVRLKLDPDSLATTETPRGLTLPRPLFDGVMRSGKNYVKYTISICSGAQPVIRSVEQSTGFVDLDHFLDAHMAEIGIAQPDSGCATASIILGPFDRACETQPIAD